MGVILDAIKDNFGVGVDFYAWDIHRLTKINYKVVQMNLKKLHNNFTLYYSHEGGNYVLYSDEIIKRRREKENEVINKYGLQNKKFKIK